MILPGTPIRKLFRHIAEILATIENHWRSHAGTRILTFSRYKRQVERGTARGDAAEELLGADLGVAPLAMLGRLPEGLSLEDGLTAVAQRLVNRLTKEAPPDRARRLLTDALLLTGLRVRRDAAVRIFRGVRAMQESDTYLMILDEGQEKAIRETILVLGEDRLGPPDEAVKAGLNNITELTRLRRIVRQTPKAASWQEILDTP